MLVLDWMRKVVIQTPLCIAYIRQLKVNTILRNKVFNTAAVFFFSEHGTYSSSWLFSMSHSFKNLNSIFLIRIKGLYDDLTIKVPEQSSIHTQVSVACWLRETELKILEILLTPIKNTLIEKFNGTPCWSNNSTK